MQLIIMQEKANGGFVFDRAYVESILARCADVPAEYSVFPDIESLMRGLAARGKVELAFAVIVEKSGRDVDAPALRLCKLEYPQLYYLLLLEECEQSSYLRFESIGIQSILLPPFSDLSLTREIATALPNVPQFNEFLIWIGRYKGIGTF